MKIPDAVLKAPRVIETTFDGWRFRSRLEARWAVVFKASGMRYQYEPETLLLPNNEGYLPDFWLPVLNCFAEVKPDGGDFSKARLLASYGLQVLLLEGSPENIEYVMLNGDSRIIYAEDPEAPWSANGNEWMEIDHTIDSTYIFPESAIEAGKTARFEYEQYGGYQRWA